MALRHRLKKQRKNQNENYIPKREAKRTGKWTPADQERGFHI